jgi:ribosomal protein S18 acetylase RimI-like enzyme
VTGLRWAPPRREEDLELAALLAAMEAVDHRGETYELDDIDDEWRSVWSHPDTDAVMVWDGPELVGFVWLTVRPGQRESHKIGQWGGVRPSYRRRGIGSQLVEWAVERATAIAPTLDDSLPTKLETDAAAHQTDLLGITEQAGYKPVRHFLEIARPTSDPPADPRPVEGLEIVAWTPELDEEARQCHVEAFADHWGSEPRTRQEWEQWYTGHRAYRADLSLLAVEPSSSQVAGLVLCGAYPQDWVSVPREAWVNTVGTRRAWRGRGVASWLLVETLQRIAAADDRFERAILGVDAENPTGALRLYRALGFDDDVRSVTTLHRPV